MSKKTTIGELLALFGGVTSVSRICGVTRRSVARWKAIDAIPQWALSHLKNHLWQSMHTVDKGDYRISERSPEHKEYGYKPKGGK